MKFLTNLTTSQVWANARHYITFFAGIAVTFGFITVTKQAEFIENASAILTAVEKIVAALVLIGGILAPIINGMISGKNASPTSQIESVKVMANTPSEPKTDEAKTALVEATNSIPEVKGVVMSNSQAGVKLAESIPAPTVVPAGTMEAMKVAKGEVL